MKKASIFLTAALMLAAFGCGGGSGSGNGIRNETASQYGGVYKSGGNENAEQPFGTLLIYPQTDGEMVFYLSKSGGAPGYSGGATAGLITIIDGKAVFRARSQCEDAYYKLHFEFNENSVTVTQEDEGAMSCGFAYAVTVNDRFERTDSEIPQYFLSDNEDAEPYYFSNWLEWISVFQAQPAENIPSELTHISTEAFEILAVQPFQERLAKFTYIKTAEELMRLYYDVEISEEGNQKLSIEDVDLGDGSHEITLIHEGLLDDSMHAQKIVMLARQTGQTWEIVEIKRNWRCQAGRGHQNWGPALCR